MILMSARQGHVGKMVSVLMRLTHIVVRVMVDTVVSPARYKLIVPSQGQAGQSRGIQEQVGGADVSSLMGTLV